jgi:hypothetical protein
MRFYPPKKDSFNLATGLPAKRLVWLKGAGHVGRQIKPNLSPNKINDLGPFRSFHFDGTATGLIVLWAEKCT